MLSRIMVHRMLMVSSRILFLINKLPGIRSVHRFMHFISPDPVFQAALGAYVTPDSNITKPVGNV